MRETEIIIMAATQYSDYYYNNTYQHIHHHQTQPQNVYGYTSTGQSDCKNLNVNDSYNYYNYNTTNNQWTSQQYNAIQSAHQHHQTQPHYHHQHLNMLNNQINDDYMNYTHQSYNNIPAPSKAIQSDAQHHSSNGRNEQQLNLNCNQYVDAKNDLYYGQQPTASLGGKINEAIAQSSPYPSSQLAEPSKKKKIDNTAKTDDSPALRALLTKPRKRAVAKCSPYFYQSQGSISPASSTDNYTQHYQLPSVPVAVAEEQLVNLNHYNQAASKEGYEQSIDDNQTTTSTAFSAVSLFAPSEATNSPMSSFMENITTPPSSPKDVSFKNDESCDNLLWNEQNGGS